MQFKVLTFQEPVRRPLPPPDERSTLLEQIRTKVIVHPSLTKIVLMQLPSSGYRGLDMIKKVIDCLFLLDALQSFNLRRTDSIERKEVAPRPVANINVAAILEKANAIRQVITTLHTFTCFETLTWISRS